jgi:DNA-binding response OmpR family regulator
MPFHGQASPAWPECAMPSRPVVVLVEDHEDTREMYADCLTFAGFRVLTAADAEDGFIVATSERPVAVVTDFRLPGASGADLCNRLKHDARTEHVPTLLVTASTQRADVERALTNGCAIVRLKPYLPDALARDILALMAGKTIPQWPSEYAV